MSKAGDIAQASAKGSFDLLWGLVISNVVMAIGLIFVARLLGSDLYGLYAIVLTAPNLIMSFRDWGVNSAMTRFTAQYRAEGRVEEVRSIFVSGLIFEIALGLTLSIISFLLSGFLATSVFNRPTIVPFIQIASFSILTSGLISAATAAFTGTEKMGLNNIMVIGQSVIRTLLTIALLIVGLSISGAVIGFTVASLIAGLIGIVLMWVILKDLPKPASLKLELKEYITEMLKYGVPLSLAVIVSGFLAQFYTFLLPIYYSFDNSIIGNYGIAQNFVVLIGFFATPITTMLFPAFSKIDPQKDKETLKNVYQFSIKYASLLVVPVAALVISLSQPAVSTLFGSTYETAYLFLALLAVSYLYTAFGSLSTGNLINSQGQTKFFLKLTLLTAAIGFPMGLVLILKFGVIGLIVTSLTSGLPSLFISLYWIKKRYGSTVDWRSSAKIIFSSAFTAVLTYAAVSQLGFASWVRLLLGLLIFVLILIPTMLFTRTFTRFDIINLKVMIEGLGAISGLVNKVLNILEKLMFALKL
jgi:O-antigen/teichoic acid export membrane protein